MDRDIVLQSVGCGEIDMNDPWDELPKKQFDDVAVNICKELDYFNWCGWLEWRDTGTYLQFVVTNRCDDWHASRIRELITDLNSKTGLHCRVMDDWWERLSE